MSTPSGSPHQPYEQQPTDPAARGYAPLAGEPLSGTVLLRPDQERLWATLAHLSPLVTLMLLPATVGLFYTGALGPLIVFLVLKNRGSFVRHQAVEALNFQILLTSVYLVAVVVGGLLSLVTFGLALLVLVPVGIAVGIAALVFQIIAAVRANQGIEYRYPISWRLVK